MRLLAASAALEKRAGPRNKSGVTKVGSDVKIYAADKSELMQVTKVERQGDNLVFKGKVFGTMPMAATLTPEEARNFRKLLTPKLAWFILTLPFRKGAK